MARFLALRAPFDALSADELADMAAETELEFHPSGAAILTEDGGPVSFLRVISAGAVSIIHAGRLLDRLSPGDSFGHDAMLAGMAPGFEARASEDTLCYRIPAAAARPLLQRSRDRVLALGAGELTDRAVATLIRTPTVLCAPDELIGAVAQRMTRAGADAALVELPDAAGTGKPVSGVAGHLGIVTDRDLRSRVIAAGLSSEAPVAAIMTTPVFTVTPDRPGSEVMFELLERGIHHVPVLTGTGRVVGLLAATDLIAPRQRSWFGVRRLIMGAGDGDSLAAAALSINPIMADLHFASVGALEISRVLSALTDALVVRALELAASPPGLVWLALTSHARRELTPASMPVGAVVCEDPPGGDWITGVAHTLAACGLPAAITARSPAQWLAADPDDLRATMVLSDRRTLYGSPAHGELLLSGEGREALLARLALAHVRAAAAPTGFDQDGVLSADGTRSDLIDIHAAAVAPIQALARWAGVAAGETGGSTAQRLAAGAAAGRLDGADAQALTDAFAAAFELRMAHQMEQIATGRRPDDIVATGALSPFMRSQLREVFRTVSAVSRRLT